MDINYDPEEDRLRFIFRDVPVADGRELAPGFHFYTDATGRVVGFEIDEASTRVDEPAQVEFTQGE